MRHPSAQAHLRPRIWPEFVAGDYQGRHYREVQRDGGLDARDGGTNLLGPGIDIVGRRGTALANLTGGRLPGRGRCGARFFPVVCESSLCQTRIGAGRQGHDRRCHPLHPGLGGAGRGSPLGMRGMASCGPRADLLGADPAWWDQAIGGH
jgi:hypothetical protein